MSDTRFGAALGPEELIAQVARDVRVRVDASGRFTGIIFGDRFAPRTAAQVEAAVMAAVQDAQRRAALTAIQLADDTVGVGVAAQLRGEYEQRLGPLDDDNDGSESERERRPD